MICSNATSIFFSPAQICRRHTLAIYKQFIFVLICLAAIYFCVRNKQISAQIYCSDIVWEQQKFDDALHTIRPVHDVLQWNTSIYTYVNQIPLLWLLSLSYLLFSPTRTCWQTSWLPCIHRGRQQANLHCIYNWFDAGLTVFCFCRTASRSHCQRCTILGRVREDR